MKISIVVATYNGEKYLKEQLESFINQTVIPDEIIISDDNSSDSTVSIINDFCDRYSKKIIVKYVQNRDVHGVTGNFNNGAKQATGDIVFFSDQDDVWYKNKIEEILKAFNKYPDCVGVFSDADCVDESLNKLGATFNEGCWSDFKKLPFDEDAHCLLKSNIFANRAVQGNILGGCCLAVRRKALTKAINFCPYIYHDDWLCYSMFVLGDVVALNESLFAYRLHGNNTVGFSTLVARKMSLRKRLKSIMGKLKTSDRLFTTIAERNIWFERFAESNNVNVAQLSVANSLVKQKIQAASSGKISGLKQLKAISIELNQYKTNYYRLESMYILLNSKKKRRKQLDKYINYYELI